MTLALTDVPSGDVPEYRDFKRHVWRCAGDSLNEPPWIYSVILQDAMEYDACYQAVTCSMKVASVAGSRFRIREDVEEGFIVYEVMFADLEALHAFLQCVAVASRVDVRMRQLGEFIMYTLGYRWV